MDSETKTELEDLLGVLPPVEFCCVYGSALHGRKRDKIMAHLVIHGRLHSWRI